MQTQLPPVEEVIRDVTIHTVGRRAGGILFPHVVTMKGRRDVMAAEAIEDIRAVCRRSVERLEQELATARKQLEAAERLTPADFVRQA